MNRTPVKAYIGLGSNLGDRKRTLDSAVAELGSLPETSVVRHSKWMENEAVGIEGGPDFLNGAAEIETRLSARDLLQGIMEIERRHGRERDTSKSGTNHQNRTLDLDLLLYGNERIDEPGLVVPHPRILERDFVLIPLAELGMFPPF